MRRGSQSVTPLPPGAPPLIVVGALRAGGSGKTPVAAALAARFKSEGMKPAVLAYRLGPGSPGADPVLEEVHADSDWRLTSEEAVLLRRETGVPVFATRHRALAWRRLAQAGPSLGGPFDVLVSDDGFQDPRLPEAVRILLLSPGENPGLFDLLPAGPWRETAAARSRAHLVLEGPLDPAQGITHVTPFFSARMIIPDLPAGAHHGPSGRLPWNALCALGNNRRFLADLAAAGFPPAAVLSAQDHAAFPEARIAAFARSHPAAGFLCTRKDFLKLPPGAAERHRIVPVDREVTLGGGAWEALERLLSGTGFPVPS